jgi:quinol monooxygenase YgiN
VKDMSPSAEVVVVATVQVKPESQDEALAAVTTAIQVTHGEEGCIAYALHRDTRDPTCFVIVEKWATGDALKEHGETAHLKALFAALGPLLTGPPTITYTSPVPAGDPAKGII